LMEHPVADVDGKLIGKLDDLIAVAKSTEAHPTALPVITALVVKDSHHHKTIVPFSDVVVLLAPAIALNKRSSQMTPYTPGEDDLYLVRDVLDKQIIDVNGVRVVRVNDLQLTRVNNHIYVSCVDVGERGLLRRLGMERVIEKIAARLGRPLPPGTISWDDVEMLPGDQPIRLRIPREKLAQLHPADIAEIISDLGPVESGAFLRALDVETAADTLEEVEPEFQASLLGTLDKEHAADVLEAMSPDEAADLLGELPAEHSRELLELMEDDEAEDVRKLLAYPENSAGGIMTTEYVTVPPNLTAEQAIASIRESAAREEAETFVYVYVVDAGGHLAGVFSLQDLILAQPATQVAEFMHHRMVAVKVQDPQDTVAQVIAKYNLLAVPVTDDAGVMQGIVTADDALDKIIPTAWKKRLPRLYH
jgi:magnesium transporter